MDNTILASLCLNIGSSISAFVSAWSAYRNAPNRTNLVVSFCCLSIDVLVVESMLRDMDLAFAGLSVVPPTNNVCTSRLSLSIPFLTFTGLFCSPVHKLSRVVIAQLVPILMTSKTDCCAVGCGGKLVLVSGAFSRVTVFTVTRGPVEGCKYVKRCVRCKQDHDFLDDDSSDMVPAFLNSVDSRLVMASGVSYISQHLLDLFDQRLVHQSVSFAGEVLVYNSVHCRARVDSRVEPSADVSDAESDLVVENEPLSRPFTLTKKMFADAWRRHRVIRTRFLTDDEKTACLALLSKNKRSGNGLTYLRQYIEVRCVDGRASLDAGICMMGESVYVAVRVVDLASD